MPVERDINLDKPITDEDIRALEEEADNLERLAKEAQEDAKKAKEFQKEEEKILNDAVKKIEALEKEAVKAEKAKNKIGRTIKEVNELAQHRSALGGMEQADPKTFGLGGMEAGAGDISGGRTGFGTGQEKTAMGNLHTLIMQREAQNLALHKKAEEDRKEIKAKQKEADEHRRDLAKKFAEQRATLGKVQKAESDFFAIGRNPMAFGMGKMTGLLAKGGIYGLIALAVIQMAQQVYEEVKKLYAPGGPYDVRKQMMDRDREIVELDHIMARRRGDVFFTSDTELQQGAPEYSNTTRLRDRVNIYQSLHLGE